MTQYRPIFRMRYKRHGSLFHIRYKRHDSIYMRYKRHDSIQTYFSYTLLKCCISVSLLLLLLLFTATLLHESHDSQPSNVLVSFLCDITYTEYGLRTCSIQNMGLEHVLYRIWARTCSSRISGI